jgi:hypothetical protein
MFTAGKSVTMLYAKGVGASESEPVLHLDEKHVAGL